MLWSVLSPLMTLLIMSLVFKGFFGSRTEHYTIYLFCGNIIFSFFSDATSGGMETLLANSHIFSKINVPKHLFLFSRNVSSLINFSLTLLVFFVFCIIDGIVFTFGFLWLIVPILCLIVFNIGAGMVLSAMFVFFRDMKYLWGVFTTLLMYMSAIFYDPAQFGAYEKVFLLNPVYVYIKYFRHVVIGVGGAAPGLPSLQYHLLALGYAAVVFSVGALIYKKMNHKFLYYV